MSASITTTRLGRRGRKTVTTIHIASGVGLLGATASTLLLALAAAASEDAGELYRVMSLQSAVLGIPLSLLSLISGVVLGLGTHWGVLRHWWTSAKLLLILAVMVNGTLMIGPSVEQLRDGAPDGATEARLVIAAAASLAMLLTATTLSVFKPGGRRRPIRC